MLPTVEQLTHFDTPVPRYTSYPTAPEWGGMESSVYEEHLRQLGGSERPTALYLHIPFCKSMCLYCGCSVVLNRKASVEDEYVRFLCREIELVAAKIGKKKRVAQLHFGGGTPTKLSEAHLLLIMKMLHTHFDIEKDSEIAIEIDPRTVVEDDAKKLSFLREIGFNRVSFGVQDLDPKVQEAVRRRQSYEVTQRTYEKARELGFESINIDLIYGLPYQTEESFQRTVEGILQLRPDRIALFSYAKVPWLKPHQKAIPDHTLPSTEEKFRIYLAARKGFVDGGYRAIGMDHFALEEDEMALAYCDKRLKRNFQGYTVLAVEDLIGLGVTSIGSVSGAYFQNHKELSSYYQAIDARMLPILRGKVLLLDDVIRRAAIHGLMCDFYLDKDAFSSRFDIPFDAYFVQELHRMKPLVEKGLVKEDGSRIVVTELGELFVRLVASCFDRYFHEKAGHKLFSKAV